MSETKSPASAALGVDAPRHEPAYVLAFDTANEVIAVGVGVLHEEAHAIELIAHAEIEARRQSNTQLIPRIDALLAENGIARGDIACVCVGRGPGSFTGVRIAMATAKGIASALEVGLVGVSSLDAVAWGVWEFGARGEVAVVADAMRKEVYPVRYLVDDAGAHRLEADRVVKADLAAEELAECDAVTSGASDAGAPEAGRHTPCSSSPRCAAELRAEHAPHAQELQAGAEGGSTCETASARGQHTPCSDSPRFAAELRAEHAVPAQKLQASSSIDAHRTPMSQVEGTLPMRQFSYRGREYATRLLGSYQPSNAAMAIEIAGALRERGWEIPDEAIARGIAETRWPARFEVLDQPAGMPTVVIDGGHNPQGAGVLADSLRDVFPDKRPVFLVGILADKDYRSMLRAVAPLASAFVCVTPPNPRALDAVDLAETIRETCGELGARATIEVAGDFDDAASAARKIAGPEGLICAFGSLYSIADVKAAFLRAADSNSLQP